MDKTYFNGLKKNNYKKITKKSNLIKKKPFREMLLNKYKKFSF